MKNLIFALILGMYVGCSSCAQYVTIREPVEIKVIQEDQTWELDDWDVVYLIDSLSAHLSSDDELLGIQITKKSTSDLPDRWGQCWENDGMIHIDLREDIPKDFLYDVLLHEFAHAAVFLGEGEDTSDHGPLWASYYGLLYRKTVAE